MIDLDALILAHGPYLSDANETEIIERLATSEDVADLALRTCTCGQRLDGFDAYVEHLTSVVKAALPPG